tara:strand:+ start:42 stop:914 length:873 start_codon:yes stop_codon:yes gene_type:complete
MSFGPIRPKVTTYGASFGTYGGHRITDTTSQGDIDPDKLNKNTLVDGVEFTVFENTVKDYILAKLGHPVVRVELSPLQLKIATDEAVTKLSYHAPLWTRNYATFDASAPYNVYEIPSFIMNNLEYVVYKKTLLSIQSQGGTLEFDFFIKYFQDNFLFGEFAVGEFYLLQSHLEQMRKILSQEGSWDILNNKYLQINPRPVQTPQRVLLEFRALDSDTIHPSYRNWIQRYALASAKGILGEIRSKYSMLPSPGGGAQLNGQALKEESTREMKELEEQLLLEIEEPPVFTTF